ncbi:hypothetical protein Cgig2_009626 [Carnegiea gigantea]|uniref:Uncharacterized protein n=1 Tax=Carnegiea gigantea TaxID=171969 RepID=A0A9Q1GPT4_9CARY|nr:hypothetical protein Cgig2_009626 [Carnegiea gigantea]
MDVDNPLNGMKLKARLLRESNVNVQLIVEKECHEVKNHTEDKLDEEGNLHIYNLQDNPYFQSVLADEDHFFTNFAECVSNGSNGITKVNNEDGPSLVNNQLVNTQVASQSTTQKFALKITSMQLKRNRRQSEGAVMLVALMKHMIASCRIIIKEDQAA